MKIYTRTGDDGTTGIIGGGRLSKADLLIEVIGEVDELNASLGVARLAVLSGASQQILPRLQDLLFQVAAVLADPKGVFGMHVGEENVSSMEEEMDRLTAELPELRNFVLPGGSAGAAQLHLCRTVCRRAERRIAQLAHDHPVPPVLLHLINRLSDLLFTLARYENKVAGTDEILWSAK
ncbi:cob(I)alamin adenosyltransferase [Terrimicrobium sacchariphilum]|uniref:Corrinoid adenosyltransferase n=1 Tax=Terrimicrobium sacchariphilum TaxID=690879 RepID=A0A146G8E2_TERSA|nr:cob(I)yrinic acid a,c-diamide adenosyltransferase [Terrimicrobium sacchariphilum]GAT33780.1 cob(I)alamin adenosyltransferase [Terrimicrobium sacchariphilum]